MSNVAAIVQDDTTAEATRPVLTECFAVMYISDVCFSAIYRDKAIEMRDMMMAKAAPRPMRRP